MLVILVRESSIKDWVCKLDYIEHITGTKENNCKCLETQPFYLAMHKSPIKLYHEWSFYVLESILQGKYGFF